LQEFDVIPVFILISVFKQPCDAISTQITGAIPVQYELLRAGTNLTRQILSVFPQSVCLIYSITYTC